MNRERGARGADGIPVRAARRVSDKTSASGLVPRRAWSLVLSVVGIAAGWVCMIAGSNWMNYQIRNRHVTEAPSTLFVGGMLMTLAFGIRFLLVAFRWGRSRQRLRETLTR